MQSKAQTRKSPAYRLKKKPEIKKELPLEAPEEPVAEKQPQDQNGRKLYCTNAQLLEEMIKWRDSNKKEEAKLRDKSKIDYTKRVISDKLALMLMEIARRVTNHSYFRNYSQETKEDMMSYGILKVIRGLKGYNFKYTNAFAYFTTAFFNAYRSECIRYYKYINLKNDMKKRYITDLDAQMPQSSLGKCLKGQYMWEPGEE